MAKPQHSPAFQVSSRRGSSSGAIRVRDDETFAIGDGIQPCVRLEAFGLAAAAVEGEHERQGAS